MNKLRLMILTVAMSVPRLVSATALEQLAGGQGAGFEAPPVTAFKYRIPEAGSPAEVLKGGGARIYRFKALYRALGYPSPNYFGSSEAQVQDLETYTDKEDSFYKEVNDYLRYYPDPYNWHGTSPEMARDMVKNIDRIFSRAPALPTDLILFRGLNLKYHANKSYEAGEEFTDKGFVSTSVSYKVARYFAIEMEANPAPEDRKAVFAIYFGRPGVKGILVDQGEDEVILKHGTKFRVMAKKDSVKKYDLYLVQACADSCDAVLRKDAAAFWAGFKIQD